MAGPTRDQVAGASIGFAGESRVRQLIRTTINHVPIPAATRQRLARFDARYRLARSLDLHGIAGPLSHDIEQWAPFVRFAPPGHFYSPIPRLDELRQDGERIFSPDVTLPGIDLRISEQFQLVEQIAPLVADDPPAIESAADRRYYADNPAYGIGDALMLYGMLRVNRPRRIVEIGSGYSSAMILDTVERHLPDTSVTFVEPYTELLRSLMRPADDDRCRILEQRAQDVATGVFTELDAGDVLLIDSTHVVRPGSDVCRLLLDVLPTLRPGVLVHIHDIFWPFQIPQSWLDEGRMWGETYLLRAYLCENPRWQVRLWTDYLAIFHADFMREQVPRFLDNGGGSIWLERV